jgi:hypothetical protein
LLRLIQTRLALRTLTRSLFLNGGNPADEIAALAIGLVVAAIVWFIMRHRVVDEDDDLDEDPPAS